MLGKIFSVKTDIVYRREESLNLFKGKKKLDKVVSGRVLRPNQVVWFHCQNKVYLSDLLPISRYE